MASPLDLSTVKNVQYPAGCYDCRGEDRQDDNRFHDTFLREKDKQGKREVCKANCLKHLAAQSERAFDVEDMPEFRDQAELAACDGEFTVATWPPSSSGPSTPSSEAIWLRSSDQTARLTAISIALRAGPRE